MVRSLFRKWMGTETMRDRLKPFLKALESRYSSNEGTVRKMLSDGWKKKRHDPLLKRFLPNYTIGLHAELQGFFFPTLIVA